MSDFIGNYVLDAEGNPVLEPDVVKWAKWQQSAARHVGYWACGDYCVSSVFLGVDHSFSSMMTGRTPVLWETMVFGLEGFGDLMERHTSRDDARATFERWARGVQSYVLTATHLEREAALNAHRLEGWDAALELLLSLPACPARALETRRPEPGAPEHPGFATQAPSR